MATSTEEPSSSWEVDRAGDPAGRRLAAGKQLSEGGEGENALHAYECSILAARKLWKTKTAGGSRETPGRSPPPTGDECPYRRSPQVSSFPCQ